MSTPSFVDLGVPARMSEALIAAGIDKPFPVQAATLPDALAGRDLCGRAPTGSGKTLGFGIPLMARVGQAAPKHPTGLVLVPTRELAEQVQRAFVPLGRASWRYVQAVYGGAPMSPQIHSLKKGASVIVATPGRLLDLIEQGHCHLDAVEVLVIDEADRMADLGFMPDVKRIIEMTPTTRQTMLWSATLDGDVEELIKQHLREPVTHDLVGELDHGTTTHTFAVTHATDRLEKTVDLLNEHGSAIVFVKTRFGVDDVTAALMNAGVRAGSLHGARTQVARQRTLEDFKRGRIQALVATDVAARGIHVDDIDVVIHWDMPDTDKDYLHRSGRTGRAGRDGLVVALIPPSRQRIASRLVEGLDLEIEWQLLPRREGDAPAGERPPRTQRPDWNAQRPGQRPGQRTERTGQRPERTGARPERREGSRADADRRGPRSDRGPRFERDDRSPARPAAAGARPERSEWSPRADRDTRREWAPRPERDDRAARGPRFERGDRPARGPAADARPGAAPRSQRDDRPAARGQFTRGDDRRPASAPRPGNGSGAPRRPASAAGFRRAPGR